MDLEQARPLTMAHIDFLPDEIDKVKVKPGITGWAQVTGFRGETKELWQMEGRVQRDIWYIEHWTSFWTYISCIRLYIM